MLALAHVTEAKVQPDPVETLVERASWHPLHKKWDWFSLFDSNFALERFFFKVVVFLIITLKSVGPPIYQYENQAVNKD